jgi:dTMP kinase
MGWFAVILLNVIGRFITFEGGEGVGKSTQIGRVAETLRATGLAVITTREPGGTPGAEAIRALLMTGSDDKWNAQTETLLFAAARADHVAKVIRPALLRGDWVLCDRFIDSTRAYQGAGGGITDDDIMALHSVGSGGLMPDRTVLLDLPAEQGNARAGNRSGGIHDRMGAKDGSYYQAVRDRFLLLAAAEPDRFAIINADLPAASVTDLVVTRLRDLLP